MAQKAADGGGDAQGPDDLTGQGKGDEGGQIGAEVDHLGVAGGGDQVEAAQGGEGQDDEGSGAGTEEAVVQAQYQADEPGQEHQ